MSKNHERILQLHSLLSKLLDSLSFQLCVNKRDENCLSLLEILIWRKKKDIDDAELLELYRSWLQSKSVFDLATSKQFEIYPKNQLIGIPLVQQNFMNVSQINKALEILNQAYNKFYYEKKPNCSAQIEQAERIFSYLDTSGYIHLRLSSIFFFTGATILLERYTVPINYEAFKIHMNDLRKQLSEVNGMVSLRGFKNYLLNLSTVKRTNYLENIMNVFADIENVIGGQKNCLPNLFDDVFLKWRSFPRFNSSQNKKNLENYRRVFQQNQKVFFDEGATLQYFLQKYGEQFVKCFQIESSLLREFNVLLKQSLNKYIQCFAKLSSHKPNHPQKNQKVNNNSTMVTHRKRELPQMRFAHKATTSMKDRTPTKSHKLIETKNTTRTPTKASNIESKIRKQFGSAEKSKEKTINRTLTPTRPLTPTKSSSRQSGALHHSQAYTQKSAIKLGVQKDSFYNKMVFFRNKRVQSYEIVMKRLRGK